MNFSATRSAFPFVPLLTLLLIAALPNTALSQTSSNELGNGGIHIIQGRIYGSNDRRSSIFGLRIRLLNYASGDLTVMADDNGTFVFRNLKPGSYTVQIDGGEIYETYRENVLIDDPGTSTMSTTVAVRSGPKIVNVQIHLKPKARTHDTPPPAVIDANWAALPNAAKERYSQGIEYLREDQLDKAEAEFRKALEISPGFSQALVELGIVEQKKGDLAKAITTWTKAAELDPKNFSAHLNLGIAYLNLKRFRESETELVTAAQLDVNAVTPHYYIGILFVLQNDLNVAARAFETARDLNGGDNLPAIHKYLGRIYAAKKMKKLAVQEFEAYLRMAGNVDDREKVRDELAKAKSMKE